MEKKYKYFPAAGFAQNLIAKVLFLWACTGFMPAQAGTGQHLLDKRVTCRFEDTALKKVLTELEKLASVNFGYSGSEVNVAEHVSVQAADRRLGDVLRDLLAPRAISYEVKGDFIILRPAKSTKPPEADSTSFRSSNNGAPRAPAPVSGKVISASDNLPMAGVSVLVKGTSRGTTTDADGVYTIEADANDVLVFTFIGYHEFETPVAGRTTIDVTLEEDPTTLDEVEVNAGYYTTTERMRTGNISRVTANDIGRQPVSNTLQALQGRMPGVEIIQQSGVPGAGIKVRVRGQNSIRPDGNYPLYVIDGVPFISTPISSYSVLFGVNGTDPLNTLNPADVESIEVLKDADATAIYGSRGANGVILITTKKGKKGKTNLDLNVYSGAGRVSNQFDLMNTQQYLQMRHEALAHDGATPDPYTDPDLTVWDTTRYTNWQKELLGGTTSSTNFQAAISGGNDRTSFRAGVGLHKESTVFPGDFGYRKTSGHFSLSHASDNDRFQMALSVTYGADKNKLFNGTIVTSALQLAPNAPALYDENGNLNWELDEFGTPTFENPASNFRNKQVNVSHNLMTTGTFSYRIVRGLIVKTNVGYTDFRQEETILFPKSAQNPLYQSFIPSTTQVLSNTVNTWIAEPQLVYTASFGDSRLDAQVGTTWQASVTGKKGFQGTGYFSEELLGNLNAAAQVSSLDDLTSDYKYNAIFGRIGYNWKEKYLINLTGRRDGSSRFGPDHQFGNFGAVGIAWLFSEESFVRDGLSFLSYGKLRASYGSAGSDQIGDYGYLDTYAPIAGPTNFRGPGGLYPTQLANPDYGWEVNRKLEGAIDLGFADDRILFSASFYRNRSSNQLVGFRLPGLTGFTSVQANLPATVQNTGIELELRTRNVQSANLTWTSSVNLTIPRNKLVAYPNIEGSAYATVYVVGEPVTGRRLFRFAGVDPVTGLYRFDDLNSDGNMGSQDLTLFQDYSRKFYGGFHNVIQYKGWMFDFLVEFVKQQGDSYLSTFGVPGFYPVLGGNQPVDVLRRWQHENDATNVQKFTQSFSNIYPHYWAQTSDRNIVDASFVRLKTIGLAYQFPTSWVQRMKVTGFSLYVRAQNLFTLTSYIGLDPQVPGSASLPPLKMITAGLQLKI